MGKTKLKAKTKVAVSKKPVKAGSTNKGGNGGIMTAKVILINKKDG